MEISNDSQIIISLHYKSSLCLGMSNNLSNCGSSYSSLILYFFFYVLFLFKGSVLKIIAKFCDKSFLFHDIVARVVVYLCSHLLMLSGDVEINQGFLSNWKEYLSICHWNLNSKTAHDNSKLFLLKTSIILLKFDIICLSEIYLDSTSPTDDDKFQIHRYTFFRCDYHSNTKHGGVCIYCRSSLP